jgi:uncharacterized protein YfdQ (DUF2303 family)
VSLADLFQYAQGLSEAVELDDIDPTLPHVISVPEKTRLETIDLERFMVNPRRPKGFLKVRDQLSFVDYINKHKVGGRTLILAEKEHVVAVFNGHLDNLSPLAAVAGWGDWGIELDLEYTESWKAWVKLAGSGYNVSESFADFLEENQRDVLDPDPQHLLDIVTNLRLASNTTVTRRVNLANGGVRFEFAEDFQPAGGGSDDSGSLEVPRSISIALQAFYDGPVYTVPALLRYRVQNGAIQWMVKFTSEQRVIFEEAFNVMCETIHTSCGVTVYRGHL